MQQVAQVIRSSLRVSEAYPIRLGGDEFLVLMLDVPLSLAQQVAQRISHSMRRCSRTPMMPSTRLSVAVATILKVLRALIIRPSLDALARRMQQQNPGHMESGQGCLEDKN